MKRQTTMPAAEFAKRLEAARLLPESAHLPSFGLMAPLDWDYHDAALVREAEGILRRKGIAFSVVTEAAPALFWYRQPDGTLRLHDWEARDAR